MQQSVKVLGYKIYADNLEYISLDAGIINTINPHSYCVAQQDKLFKEALLSSQILLPDGIGIVLASKFLARKKIEKIAGYDLLIQMLKQLESKGGTCFFLGSSQNTLERISTRVGFEYPNIKVGTFSPPFRQEFDEAENLDMIKAINNVSPDVLFVGMTAPKQEKWVLQNHYRIHAKSICSVGAVFDFYAGNVPRAPRLFINLGLEWLHRSMLSKRLLIRNLTSNPLFIFEILKSKLRSR